MKAVLFHCLLWALCLVMMGAAFAAALWLGGPRWLAGCAAMYASGLWFLIISAIGYQRQQQWKRDLGLADTDTAPSRP